MSRYLIGIDLGTTNTALAYVDLQRSKGEAGRGLFASHIIPFRVPQLVAPGEVQARDLLPSFLYLPGEHDLPAGAAALPWDAGSRYIVGEFARNHGARVPGRLVTSAKSWLCHSGVDRTAPLVPWSAPPDVQRISPVEASARYLRHLAAAWNHVMAQGKPEYRLEKQEVVLTVPASFDDMARTLTMEAARQAGLENVTLLEEPQAAFYCWLATHSAREAAALKPGAFCLVIDVGGGTSDFSLIQAGESQGELTFIRQAVGDHLLLGGDNMDLTLAHFVEKKLPQAGKLDAAQYGMLTQACRQAKETLLAPEPPDSYTVTVMGRGRAVIGGTLYTTLTPDEVKQVILDGFFPIVPRDAEPRRGVSSRRVGLHEMGLPYVSDPAITRHLAAFLKRHCQTRLETRNSKLEMEEVPAALLFNGGVFQPEVLRQRLVEVMKGWYDTPERPWQPLVLTNPSLDLAVAWGAAYYAWLRHTGGKRIGGGIARSYYIAVDTGTPDDGRSKPPDRAATTVVCVVPQHLEEGKEIVLDKPELELSLGVPVLFPLYSSTVRADDHASDVLQVAPEQLLRLPPLHTILRGGKRNVRGNVPVTLAARCTEIGTVEVYCVAREGGNRWRLEFNVRDIVREPSESEMEASAPGRVSAESLGALTQPRSPGYHVRAETSGAPGRVSAGRITDVWPEEKVQAAAELIRGTFAEVEGAPAPRELTKALEAALEAGRQRWPTNLCRRLWEFLAESADQRRRSPAHLARWYNLTGFCLRPGFGDSLDRYRVEQLWKLMHAPPKGESGKAAAARSLEGGADYWIMWRRVAGGLNTSLQNTLFNRLRPVLLPSKGKPVAKLPVNELAEMWRAAASLERLESKVKEQLGQTLMRQVSRPPVANHVFPCLTRLGARVLLYGPLNAVVHPQLVQEWIDTLLPFTPTHPSEKTSWGFCLTQLARRSGQRALDIDDSHRHSVLTVLQDMDAPPRWLRLVEEVIELEAEEEGQILGDELPIGLRLMRPTEEE